MSCRILEQTIHSRMFRYFLTGRTEHEHLMSRPYEQGPIREPYRVADGVGYHAICVHTNKSYRESRDAWSSLLGYLYSIAHRPPRLLIKISHALLTQQFDVVRKSNRQYGLVIRCGCPVEVVDRFAGTVEARGSSLS